MSVIIGDKTLSYKIDESRKIIITYMNDYDPVIDNYLNNIYQQIIPYYPNNLAYENTCGPNSKYICKNLNIDELKMSVDEKIKKGIIVITDWIKDKKHQSIRSIESIYGINTVMTIGCTYHALGFLKIIMDSKTFYIGIETTSDRPYRLQFFVGTTITEFEDIIKTCYQCTKFYVTYDCEEIWHNVETTLSDIRGGKKRNKHTRKRHAKKRHAKKSKIRKRI
jgi:hypothetical protein